MKIYSVTDPEFKPYGKVLEGYDTAELCAAMEAIPLPESGTAYRPGIDSLEACAVFAQFREMRNPPMMRMLILTLRRMRTEVLASQAEQQLRQLLKEPQRPPDV